MMPVGARNEPIWPAEEFRIALTVVEAPTQKTHIEIKEFFQITDFHGEMIKTFKFKLGSLNRSLSPPHNENRYLFKVRPVCNHSNLRRELLYIHAITGN
jgi:hypothetical protein